MAENALKSIPNKALKKILQQGTLASLLSTKEGTFFFEIYLKDHAEYLKYWDFYNTVEELKRLSEASSSKLEATEECFNKFIAIEADYNSRIVKVLNGRATVNESSKLIASWKSDPNSIPSKDIFVPLQQKSLDILDTEVFRQKLLHIFTTEKDTRLSLCCIN